MATRIANSILSAVLGVLLLLPLAPQARASTGLMPFPAELSKDVDFWIRVYTEISTSEGLLHDERDLTIVYRKLEFSRDIKPQQRRDVVDEERERIELMLKRLAAGADNLSKEEERIKEAFGSGATPERFREAAADVRFQLGQSDRFREGVERSGIWEAHIARTFAGLGLPPELAVLPHVESSFDPGAWSKVGAAGMWQFMPGTGRRYLRIDDAVDERMDPFRATEAAAQLLEYNFNLLGSWPLALTAYNHGAEGMRRARDAMGTTDIAVIARNYTSRSFGFASRNFYPSFLAALTIDRDPGKYFPDVQRRAELAFSEVEMPSYMPVASLMKALQVDRHVLAELNPGLMPAVWEGRLYVPKGYRLRLPPEVGSISTPLLAQRIGVQEQFLGQPRPRSYVVRAGDTLLGVAGRRGVSVTELAALNGISTKAMLKTGQRLRLPHEAPAAPVAVAVAETLQSQRAETQVVAQASARAEQAEPVTASEAREQGPSLVPGAVAAHVDASIDFGITEAGTIRVAAEETLGHFADWLGVPASHLRSLNKLSAGASVSQGRALKLDFSKTTRADFDAQRRSYHEALQAAFFAGHRIVGTQVYVARSGDSLWNIAHRHGTLPMWLVLHYNPEVNFNGLRAGQQVVIPKVEALRPAAVAHVL